MGIGILTAIRDFTPAQEAAHHARCSIAKRWVLAILFRQIMCVSSPPGVKLGSVLPRHGRTHNINIDRVPDPPLPTNRYVRYDTI